MASTGGPSRRVLVGEVAVISTARDLGTQIIGWTAEQAGAIADAIDAAADGDVAFLTRSVPITNPARVRPDEDVADAELQSPIGMARERPMDGEPAANPSNPDKPVLTRPCGLAQPTLTQPGRTVVYRPAGLG
jgi:hypothetical protein